MKPLIRTAVALAVVVLLAACGVTPPESAGHGGHGGQGGAPVVAPLRDGERFMSLTMAEAYTPSAPRGGTDDYRCFVIDPGLSEQAFLTGAQFLPQNVEIVHHAIFFRLDPERAAEASRRDESTPGQGWTCFGDAGIEEAAWVAHWAPGTKEILLDPAYGYAMPPGSKLVMQVHYNTLNVEGEPGSDRSGIRLRVTGRKVKELDTVLFPAPVELPCTKEESGPLCDREAAVKDVGRRFGQGSEAQVGVLAQECGTPKPGPTQHCDFPIEGPAKVHALAGHMHLLGRAIKVELNPGTDRARTLLDVPTYNFDDQALRPLPEPVTVDRGDVVRVTCTHDAKLRSMLPELSKLEPRYVVWGEGTSDEMCLGIVIVSAT
ncbi:monooxygenase [Nonomuraea glycinis]|uniref:monooxygenase n=1 Tax=Nonomuraea glycinis TaxID=2047744 RepID=UPI001667ADDE|nr:monooxygenase [Nonomuraea glycinis]MCA2180289.1 monooxygenase [Nonomuraea glycinis]